MNNKSYQQIFDQFGVMFPEFSEDIIRWHRLSFNKEVRDIVLWLKNGCSIIFGTIRDEDENWMWIASLDMSNETKQKLEVKTEE